MITEGRSRSKIPGVKASKTCKRAVAAERSFQEAFRTSCVGSRVARPVLERDRSDLTLQLYCAPDDVSIGSVLVGRSEQVIITKLVFKERPVRVKGVAPNGKESKTNKQTKEHKQNKQIMHTTVHNHKGR